jgi:hypothetical protein
MADFHNTGLTRVHVIRETEKALLVRVDNTGGVTRFNRQRVGEVWLPKSRVEWRSSQYGEELFAPAWLIRDKL